MRDRCYVHAQGVATPSISVSFSHLVGSDVPLLGKIPFGAELREGGDAGEPVVISAPDSPSAQAIQEIVAKLIVREKSLLGVRLGLA